MRFAMLSARGGRLLLQSAPNESKRMSLQNIRKLAELIEQRREELLAQWRLAVRELPSARHLDTPNLNDHIPVLLEELSAALHNVSEETISQTLLEGSPPVHGQQRYEHGFDILEVVAEYNILRGCVHDLADRHGIMLQGRPFHILNRVLDEAIGLAVQTFATEQALTVQRRREEYLAFVAHDLRTPLNAISLAASVLDGLLGGADVPPQISRMLKTLHRNVGHLEALVTNVLKENEHMETESGVRLERRHFDLWPLVESLTHDLNPIAGTASLQLTNRVPEDLRVYADASLIKRVFQNLVANAIKYTPRGEVVISARPLEDGQGVECSVADNGAGIAEDRLEIIFQKLEGDPTREGGLGLGLAIVKTFVEAHGGKVTVESREGIGSTFVFTLPGPTG